MAMKRKVETLPPIKTVKDQLIQSKTRPITVRALAEKLGLTPDHIHRMIKADYLCVIMEKTDPNETVVFCPKEDTLDWIKMMHQPLYKRPFVRLAEVHSMLERTQGRIQHRAAEKTRRVCLTYNIPIYLDPYLGELITPEGLAALARHMWIYRNPKRYDRVTMLAFLLNSIPTWGLPNPNGRRLYVPRYTKRLELEIVKAVHLPEPERTLRVMELYEAWRDSRTAQECVARLKDYADKRTFKHRWKSGMKEVRKTIKEIWRTDQRMEKAKNQVTADDGTDQEADQEDDQAEAS